MPTSLPPVEPDKALLVMGFSTELAAPYEGAILYSGFSATQLDDTPLSPPFNQRAVSGDHCGPAPPVRVLPLATAGELIL